MGGTSCDVCLIADGDVGETAERLIGGRPLALPALDIQTVGAGRRVDRLARRRRGAAGGPGLGRCASPAPPATGSAASSRR